MSTNTIIFHVILTVLQYCVWCWRPDSNWGPTDYKSVALPTELRQLSFIGSIPEKLVSNSMKLEN